MRRDDFQSPIDTKDLLPVFFSSEPTILKKQRFVDTLKMYTTLRLDENSLMKYLSSFFSPHEFELAQDEEIFDQISVYTQRHVKFVLNVTFVLTEVLLKKHVILAGLYLELSKNAHQHSQDKEKSIALARCHACLIAPLSRFSKLHLTTNQSLLDKKTQEQSFWTSSHGIHKQRKFQQNDTAIAFCIDELMMLDAPPSIKHLLSWWKTLLDDKRMIASIALNTSLSEAHRLGSYTIPPKPKPKPKIVKMAVMPVERVKENKISQPIPEKIKPAAVPTSNEKVKRAQKKDEVDQQAPITFRSIIPSWLQPAILEPRTILLKKSEYAEIIKIGEAASAGIYDDGYLPLFLWRIIRFDWNGFDERRCIQKFFPLLQLHAKQYSFHQFAMLSLSLYHLGAVWLQLPQGFIHHLQKSVLQLNPNDYDHNHYDPTIFNSKFEVFYLMWFGLVKMSQADWKIHLAEVIPKLLEMMIDCKNISLQQMSSLLDDLTELQLTWLESPLSQQVVDKLAQRLFESLQDEWDWTAKTVSKIFSSFAAIPIQEMSAIIIPSLQKMIDDHIHRFDTESTKAFESYLNLKTKGQEKDSDLPSQGINLIRVNYSPRFSYASKLQNHDNGTDTQGARPTA